MSVFTLVSWSFIFTSVITFSIILVLLLWLTPSLKRVENHLLRVLKKTHFLNETAFHELEEILYCLEDTIQKLRKEPPCNDEIEYSIQALKECFITHQLMISQKTQDKFNRIMENCAERQGQVIVKTYRKVLVVIQKEAVDTITIVNKKQPTQKTNEYLIEENELEKIQKFNKKLQFTSCDPRKEKFTEKELSDVVVNATLIISQITDILAKDCLCNSSDCKLLDIDQIKETLTQCGYPDLESIWKIENKCNEHKTMLQRNGKQELSQQLKRIRDEFVAYSRNTFGTDNLLK